MQKWITRHLTNYHYIPGNKYQKFLIIIDSLDAVYKPDDISTLRKICKFQFQEQN